LGVLLVEAVKTAFLSAVVGASVLWNFLRSSCFSLGIGSFAWGGIKNGV
jgi:hypothetical protein